MLILIYRTSKTYKTSYYYYHYHYHYYTTTITSTTTTSTHARASPFRVCCVSFGLRPSEEKEKRLPKVAKAKARRRKARRRKVKAKGKAKEKTKEARKERPAFQMGAKGGCKKTGGVGGVIFLSSHGKLFQKKWAMLSREGLNLPILIKQSIVE